MDVTSAMLHIRGRGGHDVAEGKRPHSRNKQWVAGEGGTRGAGTTSRADGERWERGGHRGGRGARGAARGAVRKFPNVSLRVPRPPAVEQEHEPEPEVDASMDDQLEQEHDEEEPVVEDPDPDSPEDREKFYQELVREREVERKKAIAEGKMDDPFVPKRLEDAISIVGTCMDMCPRFERYRRERENNLFEWETKPGTKRVDHKRAVKMYERAAGDKTLPSDLRPPLVLKRTLDYLFHDLLPRGGFSQTFNFIRDRSRAVRNDFTMQHDTGPLAIECHDRCARFHILALHFERDRKGFSIALEEQQLMNTLQSLKEFYEDQRGRYESPTELEMRVYHRLIHIRDQKERHEDIPEHITSHPVFKLTTDFRLHVQKKSAPISKVSPLVVDVEGMQIFGQLAAVLREAGSVVMIYLVACLLERLFGKETIDDIESIRGDLSIPDIIDGNSGTGEPAVLENGISETQDDEITDIEDEEVEEEVVETQPAPLAATATEFLATNFPQTTAPAPSAPRASAFATLAATPNVFNTPSVFGTSAFAPAGPAKSIFGDPAKPALFGVSSSASPASAPFSAPKAPEPVPSTFASASQPSAPPIAVAAPLAPTTTPSFPSEAKGGRPNFFASSLAKLSNPSTSPPSNGITPAQSTTSAPLPSSSEPTSALPSSSFFSKPLASASGSSAAPPTFSSTSAASPMPPAAFSFPSSTPPAGTSTSTNDPASKRGFPGPSAPSHPPALPRINTNTSALSSPVVPSPRDPPPLGRVEPVPLPYTPTVAPPLPGFFKSNASLKSLAGPGSGALSPLFLSTPTVSRQTSVQDFAAARSSTSLLQMSPSAEKPNPFSKANGKLKEVALRNEAAAAAQKAEHVAQAIEFSRRCFLVRQCFARWQKRATDRAAWVEACRKSDAYHQKVQRERLSSSVLSKKRRVSADLSASASTSPSLAHQKKRARRRVSAEYQAPRTDQELARRFKENQTEHERRWAQGSFLGVVRTHVQNKFSNSRKSPEGWRVWLSMNPEVDATAIWLERKFDVPASGDWESETVFSIPLERRKAALSSPGILVFECTPLEGITDELERKFRILEDCARLRDIIKGLPAKRRYIPAVLIIAWADGDATGPPADVVSMITKRIEDGSIGGYSVFPVTSVTTDLDQKFSSALESLSLDLEGKLVHSLALRDVLKLFQSPFNTFISEWLINCSAYGDFDWTLHGRLIQASINILNSLVACLSSLIDARIDVEHLPDLNSTDTADAESTYAIVISWLEENGPLLSAASIAVDLKTHQDMGRDFPSSIFIDHLLESLFKEIEAHIPQPSGEQFVLPKDDVKNAVEQFYDAIKPHAAKLRQALSMSARRSPKRRSLSIDSRATGASESKRRRLSSATSSPTTIDVDASPPPSPLVNGRASPSPSASAASAPSEPAPLVTVAMLRALTRDMKQRYTAGGG